MRTALFIIATIYLLGCQKKNQLSDERQVYNDVLFIVVDSITEHYDINKRHSILVNSYDDHIDSLAVLRYRDTLTVQNKKSDVAILNKLFKILNEPLIVNTDSLSRDHKIKLLSNKSSMDKEYKENNENVFSLMCLSNVAFNDDKTKGYFYIDIQRGSKWHNDKGFLDGYIVSIEKKEDRWIVVNLIQMWGETLWEYKWDDVSN